MLAYFFALFWTMSKVRLRSVLLCRRRCALLSLTFSCFPLTTITNTENDEKELLIRLLGEDKHRFGKDFAPYDFDDAKKFVFFLLFLFLFSLIPSPLFPPFSASWTKLKKTSSAWVKRLRLQYFLDQVCFFFFFTLSSFLFPVNPR
jgi:hypothetical protein